MSSLPYGTSPLSHLPYEEQRRKIVGRTIGQTATLLRQAADNLSLIAELLETDFDGSTMLPFLRNSDQAATPEPEPRVAATALHDLPGAHV